MSQFSYRWNPFTGAFDQVFLPAAPTAISFLKKAVTVDLALISGKVILLDANPVLDSERVFLNGLLLDDSCYTVSGVNIILDAGLDIEVGDFIDIRYVPIDLTVISFLKKAVTVDLALISGKVILLDQEPVLDSERVFLNGLILDDSCYTVSGDNIILDAGLDIRVGDFISIRYAI